MSRQAFRFDGLWWRQFAYLGCVYGPDWWKHYSPPAIGAIIFALIHQNRRGAMANMKRILGIASQRRVALETVKMFGNFAQCYTETMEFYGPRPAPVRIDPPARDLLADAMDAGRGAVVLTAHFGNWDIAAKTLCSYGRPISLVMAREANETTAEYLRASREGAGVRIIYSDSSVFASLNMIRALRQNEIVALQLDRVVGKTRPVPIFGGNAEVPVGPFVLARVAGAPLIPVFIPRLGRRHYAIRLGRPLVVPRERSDMQTIDHAMRTVLAEFEELVREFPSQWFQFAPFWPADAGSVSGFEDRPDERLSELPRVNRKA